MKKIQLLRMVILAAVSGATLFSARSLAYQSMMKKAKQYGAKDCLFCHVYEDGGEGWNERGLWLIDQKYVRKAERIDPAWLKDYRSEETATVGPSEVKKKKSSKPSKKKKP